MCALNSYSLVLLLVLLLLIAAAAAQSLTDLAIARAQQVVSLAAAAEAAWAGRCASQKCSSVPCLVDACSPLPASRSVSCAGDALFGTPGVCPAFSGRQAMLSSSVSFAASLDVETRTQMCALHLDTTYTSIAAAYPSAKWQVFGTKTGYYQSFPGHVLSGMAGTACSSATEYDPRIAPWFVSAASGPKNVIIMLDISGSMTAGGSDKGVLSIAAAEAVLDALTPVDWVSVVTFCGVAHPCTSTLLQATAENIFLLKACLPVPIPANYCGGTSFLRGLNAVFDVFNASFVAGAATACNNSAVLLLTDGDPTDGLTGAQYVSAVAGMNTYGAHIFSYAIGTDSLGATLKIISCANRGTLQLVTDPSNITAVMTQYYAFLAAGVTEGTVRWLAPFVDPESGVLVTTASVAAYDRSVWPPSLLGVAAIDWPMSDFETGAGCGVNQSFAFLVERSARGCEVFNLTECQMEAVRLTLGQEGCGMCDTPVAPIIDACAVPPGTPPPFCPTGARYSNASAIAAASCCSGAVDLPCPGGFIPSMTSLPAASFSRTASGSNSRSSTPTGSSSPSWSSTSVSSVVVGSSASATATRTRSSTRSGSHSGTASVSASHSPSPSTSPLTTMVCVPIVPLPSPISCVVLPSPPPTPSNTPSPSGTGSPSATSYAAWCAAVTNGEAGWIGSAMNMSAYASSSPSQPSADALGSTGGSGGGASYSSSSTAGRSAGGGSAWWREPLPISPAWMFNFSARVSLVSIPSSGSSSGGGGSGGGGATATQQTPVHDDGLTVLIQLDPLGSALLGALPTAESSAAGNASSPSGAAAAAASALAAVPSLGFRLSQLLLLPSSVGTAFGWRIDVVWNGVVPDTLPPGTLTSASADSSGLGPSSLTSGSIGGDGGGGSASSLMWSFSAPQQSVLGVIAYDGVSTLSLTVVSSPNATTTAATTAAGAYTGRLVLRMSLSPLLLVQQQRATPSGSSTASPSVTGSGSSLASGSPSPLPLSSPSGSASVPQPASILPALLGLDSSSESSAQSVAELLAQRAWMGFMSGTHSNTTCTSSSSGGSAPGVCVATVYVVDTFAYTLLQSGYIVGCPMAPFSASPSPQNATLLLLIDAVAPGGLAAGSAAGLAFGLLGLLGLLALFLLLLRRRRALLSRKRMLGAEWGGGGAGVFSTAGDNSSLAGTWGAAGAGGVGRPRGAAVRSVLGARPTLPPPAATAAASLTRRLSGRIALALGVGVRGGTTPEARLKVPSNVINPMAAAATSPQPRGPATGRKAAPPPPPLALSGDTPAEAPSLASPGTVRLPIPSTTPRVVSARNLSFSLRHAPSVPRLGSERGGGGGAFMNGSSSISPLAPLTAQSMSPEPLSAESSRGVYDVPSPAARPDAMSGRWATSPLIRPPSSGRMLLQPTVPPVFAPISPPVDSAPLMAPSPTSAGAAPGGDSTAAAAPPLQSARGPHKTPRSGRGASSVGPTQSRRTIIIAPAADMDFVYVGGTRVARRVDQQQLQTGAAGSRPRSGRWSGASPAQPQSPSFSGAGSGSGGGGASGMSPSSFSGGGAGGASVRGRSAYAPVSFNPLSGPGRSSAPSSRSLMGFTAKPLRRGATQSFTIETSVPAGAAPASSHGGGGVDLFNSPFALNMGGAGVSSRGAVSALSSRGGGGAAHRAAAASAASAANSASWGAK